MGNRSGFFARAGDPTWWMDMVARCAAWADRWAQIREHEIGAEAYARELGLAVESYLTAIPNPAKEGAAAVATAEAFSPYDGQRSFVQERETAEQVARALKAGVSLRNILLIGESELAPRIADAIAAMHGGQTEQLAGGGSAGDFAVLLTSLATKDVLVVPDS